MSTSETDEYKIGKCPCGNGDIIKSVTTQDNPWSGADIYYRVDCDKCRGEWDLSSSGERLTLRNSLIPSESAGKIQTLARQDLDTYIRSLAEKYFTSLALSSKKAEHAKLVELNIANGSYRTHLENRKRSKLHEVGYLGRNPAFVKELLDMTCTPETPSILS